MAQAHTSRGRERQEQALAFHNDYGHDTEECRHRKEAIDELVEKGLLDNFMKRAESRAESAKAENKRPLCTV